MPKGPQPVKPTLLILRSVADRLTVDARELGRVMQELGISPETIRNTALFIDERNYWLTNGVTYPNVLGRLRYFYVPALRSSKGQIVRVSWKVQGKERSDKQMNKTLVHELEHVAQAERKDLRRIVGNGLIWGLAAAGAVLGYWLARESGRLQTVVLMTCALLGQRIGYRVAPHEMQARKRERTVTITVISRKNKLYR